MDRNSNTLLYIILAVVVGHFVIGIVWLILKINRAGRNKEETEINEKDNLSGE